MNSSLSAGNRKRLSSGSLVSASRTTLNSCTSKTLLLLLDRTLYSFQCSAEQPGLTVRFPSEGVDGTNVSVTCSGTVPVSSLGKRIVHYVWNNEASCEEFVAAGIRAVLREYRSLGAALAASGGGGRFAGALARFCRAAGLSERDHNTLKFFAQLYRLKGNV